MSAGEFVSLCAPLLDLAIIDQMIGTQIAQTFELLSARTGGDHRRPRSLGKLKGEDRDSTAPLNEHRIARLDGIIDEQGAPCR